MIAIFFNVIAVIVGSAIGALAKRGISEKYITVLNTAMGLAALVLGINVAMANMAKSQLPVLFIFCLSFGGLLGTMLRLDQRMEQRECSPHRRHHNSSSVLLRWHTFYDGTCVSGLKGRQHLSHDSSDSQSSHYDSSSLQLWVWSEPHGTCRLCVARRHLRHCKTVFKLHLRSFNFGSIHSRWCTYCCCWSRSHAYQRLQDYQSITSSFHAHALFFW